MASHPDDNMRQDSPSGSDGDQRNPEAHQLEGLLRSAFRRLNRSARPQLEALGLTPPRLWALVHVRRSEGLSMGELAERMSLSKSTVTTLVDELVKSRLLQRRQDPSDRRVQRLYLTAHGWHTLEKALQAREAVLSRAIAGWSPEDVASLLSGLERLRNGLDHCGEV